VKGLRFINITIFREVTSQACADVGVELGASIFRVKMETLGPSAILLLLLLLLLVVVVVVGVVVVVVIVVVAGPSGRARRTSAAARLLRSWVLISPGA
jgi:hypothetical protein